jgi:hypothetical protein
VEGKSHASSDAKLHPPRSYKYEVYFFSFFLPLDERVYQDRVVELAVDKGWALSVVLSVHESRPGMDVDAVF